MYKRLIMTLMQRIKVSRESPQPIYYQLARQFSHMIAKNVLSPGEKLPQPMALGRELGLNYRTVRQAYRELVHEGLVKADKKGVYVNNRAGFPTNHKTILVVCSHPLHDLDEHQYYLKGIYSGIRSAGQEEGWDCGYQSIPELARDNSRIESAAGVIMFGTTSIMRAHLEQICQTDKPVVAVGGDSAACPRVRSDDEQGMSLMMQHLLDLGHRRIGLIVNSPDVYSAQHCFKAYFKAMADISLDITPTWIHIAEDRFLQDVDEQETLFNNMFDSPKAPTAVIAGNGYLAMSLLGILHRHDVHVPRKVSVCCFGDFEPMRFASPPLTTIRQDLAGLGTAALASLIDRMHGKKVPDTVLPVELVVRESTAALSPAHAV